MDAVAGDEDRPIRALDVYGILADIRAAHELVVLDVDVLDAARILTQLDTIRADVPEGIVANDHPIHHACRVGAGDVDRVNAVARDARADIVKGVALDKDVLGILDHDGNLIGIAKDAIANDFLDRGVLVNRRVEGKEPRSIAVVDLAVAEHAGVLARQRRRGSTAVNEWKEKSVWACGWR